MNFERRDVLQLGALALLVPWSAQAQPALLPLKTPGLDHLDLIVPDVEKTSKFYMGMFNTTLHAQPFQGAFRYFVLLGTLNDKREVGYLAIGAARGRGTYIGHFCTSVFDWGQNSKPTFEAMKTQFTKAGFGDFPGSTGFGGIFTDPDGIEIQFLPAPDTLVTAAVPSELVPWKQGLVTPRGVDHVLLHVTDLKRALDYYTILYGPHKTEKNSKRAYFEFPASRTRLVLEQPAYEYGNVPKIAHFGIKVDMFDKDKTAAALTALGATILPSPDESSVLRLRDPDGNVVELCPV